MCRFQPLSNYFTYPAVAELRVHCRISGHYGSHFQIYLIFSTKIKSLNHTGTVRRHKDQIFGSYQLYVPVALSRSEYLISSTKVKSLYPTVRRHKDQIFGSAVCSPIPGAAGGVGMGVCQERVGWLTRSSIIRCWWYRCISRSYLHTPTHLKAVLRIRIRDPVPF